MITPSILAVLLGVTVSPLIVIGIVLVQSARLVKCISIVFSPSKVAPLRSSQSIAVSRLDA